MSLPLQGNQHLTLFSFYAPTPMADPTVKTAAFQICEDISSTLLLIIRSRYLASTMLELERIRWPEEVSLVCMTLVTVMTMSDSCSNSALRPKS